MREEIVGLLQRQYRNYRDFLIDIDRAKEISEQNDFNFRCLDCYCEADEIDLHEFGVDFSVSSFYKKYKGVCSVYYQDRGCDIFCRFFKQGGDIVLSYFNSWYCGFDCDYETKIIFKEKDFLDFCFQREDWNRIAVVQYGEESVFNQYKVFRQGCDEVLFEILKELCSIIIEFDRNQYDENR